MIKTSLTEVDLIEQNIIEVKFTTDDYQVDIDDQNEMNEAIGNFVSKCDSKANLLVITGKRGGITKSARNQEIFDSHPYTDIRTMALVLHSSRAVFISKIYFQFKADKPSFDLEIFSDREEAINWIHKFSK